MNVGPVAENHILRTNIRRLNQYTQAILVSGNVIEGGVGHSVRRRIIKKAIDLLTDN